MKSFIKNLLPVITVCTLLASCNDKPLTPIEFGERILDAYVKGDTTRIYEMIVSSATTEAGKYFLKNDIRLNNEKFRNRIFKSLNLDTIITEHLDPKLGIPDEKLIRCDFKLDTSYFRMEMNYVYDSLKMVRISDMYLANISFECQQGIGEPFKPEFAVCKELVWQSDYRGTTFMSAKARIKNYDGEDITFIKFRIRMVNKYGIEFFNQTTSSYSRIPGGDIVEIEVPGLNNYYAGIPINDKDWTFKFQVIDVLPRPIPVYCKILAEVKKLEHN